MIINTTTSDVLKLRNETDKEVDIYLTSNYDIKPK